MPTITATPFINKSYVLVEVDWADVPAATCARVLRVRVDTGEETPLRPYVIPCGGPGEFQELSGGRAIFWDTEAPLDTLIYYRTETDISVFMPGQIRDTFSRTVVDGWDPPVSDSGHTYQVEGGAGVTDFDVNSGMGHMTMGSVNNSRRAFVETVLTDSDQYVTVSIPVTTTGASAVTGLFARAFDLNNFYRYNVIFNTDNTIGVSITLRSLGVDTTLASGAAGVMYSPNERIRARARTVGSTHQLKVWEEASPEPAAFNLTTTDGVRIEGMPGMRSILNAGNTNALPFNISYDNHLIVTNFMVVATEPLMMPSNGYFWLKDPVRPCNDRRVTTNKMLPPDCPPGSGIFFLNMEEESYAPNSLKVLPTNAQGLIHVSRTRRQVGSMLNLATRTFMDRDDVLRLNEPGSPLLFQAAPEYGIADRYMGIETVGVTRGLPNHRYQTRVISLPFDQVNRPVGTTLGICGSRFMDLCDIYDTWDEMAAAGLLYEGLITGAASQPDEGFNSWDDIEAAFTDWDAVEAAFDTWEDVAGGP